MFIMKGLRKVLTPFAPDQSGAVSVLYELGGIIVIADAGGCAGNICGFDEPRWENEKSAVFSAGLRDMDAIMGRDDRLADKIADAASKIEAHFIAVIGTPVPAVIATDWRALERMIEKRCGLPVITIDTNGMELYDKGQEKALFAVYEKFAGEKYEKVPQKTGILGAAPPDFGKMCPPLSLDDIKKASSARINIAVSPAAVKTARLLEKRFGTPYEIRCPDELLYFPDGDFEGRNILIVHQHVIADTLRKRFTKVGASNVTCAGWFMLSKEIMSPGDISLKEEDDFEKLVKDGGFDIIAADAALKPLAKGFAGEWIDYPHFALSGRMPAIESKSV